MVSSYNCSISRLFRIFYLAKIHFWRITSFVLNCNELPPANNGWRYCCKDHSQDTSTGSSYFLKFGTLIERLWGTILRTLHFWFHLWDQGLEMLRTLHYHGLCIWDYKALVSTIFLKLRPSVWNHSIEDCSPKTTCMLFSKNHCLNNLYFAFTTVFKTTFYCQLQFHIAVINFTYHTYISGLKAS